MANLAAAAAGSLASLRPAAAAATAASSTFWRRLTNSSGGGSSDGERPLPPAATAAAAAAAADAEASASPGPSSSLADAGAFAAADALWPTSRRQKAAAARNRRAQAAVLADPAAAGLRGQDVHTLTVRCGLALGGVRGGQDGRTAHILYDVTPGTEAAAAAVLGGPLAGPLRSAVGRTLGARRAPVLKWTPDRLGGGAAAVVAELDRLGLPSRVR